MDKYIVRRLLHRILRNVNLYNKQINKKITDIIDGNEITYNRNTDIGLELYLNGSFEKNELELCKRYINEDSVILDIGANIGLHSLYFSRLAKNGLIISFEPSKETFAYLLENIASINNILPVNIAASNITKIADFYVTTDNAYSSLKDTKRKKIKNILSVISMKLDDFFEKIDIQKIDFVKIDVEGFEQNVFEGMENIINKYRPIIYCEIYKGKNSNDDPDKTVNYVINKGYDAFIFDGIEILEYKIHDDKYYNYLFIPKIVIA